MTDGEVRAPMLQMAEDITTQDKDITIQDNREVVTRENQHASTMASRLTDFKRMNPSISLGSKVYTIFFAMGVEDNHLKKRYREAKKARSFESGSFNNRLDMQDKPQFKKRFSNQVPSNFYNNCNNGGSNLKPQKERNVNPPKERPICGKCGEKDMGECLVGTNSCYGCGKVVHIVKDCPYVRIQGKANGQTQSSAPSFDGTKRNLFYELKASGEQEIFPKVVTSILEVFS
ncbi:uncharacterized protein [Solanum lycopersicum]|uniref:uncharacterized protein n=1 Tax=Solanum lycopersicum TaxID=4081 RepID=UPI000532E250|nr:uncharacterized protein LOC104646870 [Solanum lycopersicum]